MVLASLWLSAASCTDDPSPALSDQLSSTPPSLVLSTTTTRTPTTTLPDYPTTDPTTTTGSPDGSAFVVPRPPVDLRPCAPATDLFAVPGYPREPSRSLSVNVLFVINISDSPCGLQDPGFLIRGDTVPIGGPLDYAPGSPVLDRGERAVFMVTAPRPEGSFDSTLYDTLTFGLGDDFPLDSGFASAVEGVAFIGPVEWSGPPESPAVYVPGDPTNGAPIADDDPVSVAGVGAFRAGMSPQEVADATGNAFVAVEWGEASGGCGYGWLSPGLGFTISSASESLDTASVGAVLIDGSHRTPSGIGVGTSVDELRDALGDDRLSTRLNEYSGTEDYLFTPRDPTEQHLGMFFRIDHETLTVTSYEAGLQTQLGRGEGCA